MTPEQRGAKVEELKACPKCTDWRHGKKQCWMTGLVCKEKENGARRRRGHHTSLHHSKNAFCEANAIVACMDQRRGSKDVVLLAIQEVDVKSQGGLPLKAIVFHDDGATVSLCRHTWAMQMGLPSQPVSMYLKR